MAEFKLPPISTLAGSPLHLYLRLIAQNHIGSKYILKTILTGLMSAVGVPFRWYESLTIDRKVTKHELTKPPLFILGHWRSGTTLLHNLLCQDPAAAYISTYHSVFPNNLASKMIFKSFMRASMPESRPSDNVKLSVDFPQEEEFTLGNLHPWAYYYFWYFPKKYQQYFNNYALFQGDGRNHREKWKRQYNRLLLKAAINTGGEQLFVKNPVNTARIPILLEEFPEAKFIHIYRNPVIVYLSTYKFFTELFPTLWFHEISDEDIKEMILTTYQRLMEEYLASKHLIPKGTLVELRYEDFEKEPLQHLNVVYHDLELEGLPTARAAFETYWNSQKGHRVNTYQISKSDLDAVLARWHFAMEKWQYQVPANLKIT